MRWLSFLFLALSYLSVEAQPTYPAPTARHLLRLNFQRRCYEPSDINQHVPVLQQLSRECSSVIEIGVRSMNSSWGILQGLAESSSTQKSYLGIDLNYPPEEIFQLAKSLSEGVGIDFQFWEANDMDVDIEPADMLFIDSLHTYCHLTYELEKFSPKIRKYISMHDTSADWEAHDDGEYHGDYSEYPARFDRTKRGLWPAVQDFLDRHSEWKLKERRLNNYGFTVLKRVSQ